MSAYNQKAVILLTRRLGPLADATEAFAIEQIINHKRAAEILLSQGQTVAEVCGLLPIRTDIFLATMQLKSVQLKMAMPYISKPSSKIFEA